MVHFEYVRTERKLHIDDMDIDAIFHKLASLSNNVNEAHELLLKVQARHMKTGKVDVRKLAEGIVKSNEDFKGLMDIMRQEGQEAQVDESAIEDGDDDEPRIGMLKRRETNAEARTRLSLGGADVKEAIIGGEVVDDDVKKPRRRESNAEALERLKKGGWDGKRLSERKREVEEGKKPDVSAQEIDDDELEG